MDGQDAGVRDLQDALAHAWDVNGSVREGKGQEREGEDGRKG